MNSDLLRKVLANKEAQREGAIEARRMVEEVFRLYPLDTAYHLSRRGEALRAQVAQDVKDLNAGHPKPSLAGYFRNWFLLR